MHQKKRKKKKSLQKTYSAHKGVQKAKCAMKSSQEKHLHLTDHL